MRLFKIITISLIILSLAVVGLYYSYYRVTQKSVVVLLYEDFVLLDAVGAYQTASGLMLQNYSIKFVAKNKGRVKSSYMQSLEAANDISEISDADILILPGVENPQSVIADNDVMAWIKKIDAKTERTLSVGSGNLVLAATGVLKNKKVAAPWHDKTALEQYGIVYTDDNYVRDGKYYTGMGASASIDGVLAMIADLADDELSKTTQLFIAYDPQPPVQSGFYDQADSTTRRLADAMAARNTKNNGKTKTIGLYLYPGFTMLDVSGPYQVFRELESLGYEMKFLSNTKGIIQSDFIQSLEAPYSIDQFDSLDVLFVPGGSTTYKILNDIHLIDWVKKIDMTTSYTTSVCTGSVLLGEAQLLKGRRATSHWYVGPKLDEFGITYSHERYTKDGKYITGAGVSSGIDLALYVVKELEGDAVAKAIQLQIGYFPHPPFDAGTPEKSDPKTVSFLSGMFVNTTDRGTKSGESAGRTKIAAIDPVCKMTVDNHSDSLVHDGVTYHFCSALCKEKFAKDPSKYKK